MTADDIQRALADITAEADPTLKHFKLASLVSAVFRERGTELVVVGGSAISSTPRALTRPAILTCVWPRHQRP
jgi:hypothetical protein